MIEVPLSQVSQSEIEAADTQANIKGILYIQQSIKCVCLQSMDELFFDMFQYMSNFPDSLKAIL